MADILTGSTAWLGLLPLPMAAIFLAIWRLGWPHTPKDLVTHIALGSLVLSFAASINPMRLATAGDLWALDGVSHVARVLFLGAAILSWFGRPHPPASRIGTTIELLSVWAGVLALSTQDLATLWIALGLYVLPSSFSKPLALSRLDDRNVRQLALMVLLFGVALLYASSGTLSLVTLNRLLWVQGGPRPPLFYVGLGLSVCGIGAATRLLPPYGPENACADVVSPLLGAGLLLRLSQGCAVLAWEWMWLFHALAALALIWALAAALRAADREVYLGRLAATQRAFLLWAVALGWGPQGREIVILVGGAFLLDQMVVSVGLQRIAIAREGEMSSPLVGVARHSPWLGMPFGVALLSQAAFPMTLGFVGRLVSIWAARDQVAPWIAWSGLVASAVCALFYLPALLAVLRRGSRRAYVEVPRPLLGGLILAACALLAFGLYPRPLQILARWLGG